MSARLLPVMTKAGAFGATLLREARHSSTLPGKTGEVPCK